MSSQLILTDGGDRSLSNCRVSSFIIITICSKGPVITRPAAKQPCLTSIHFQISFLALHLLNLGGAIVSSTELPFNQTLYPLRLLREAINPSRIPRAQDSSSLADL